MNTRRRTDVHADTAAHGRQLLALVSRSRRDRRSVGFDPSGPQKTSRARQCSQARQLGQAGGQAPPQRRGDVQSANLLAARPRCGANLPGLRHVLELRLFLIHGAPILYEPLKDAVIFERMGRPNQQEITANPERTQIARRLLVRFSTLKETADLAARINVALGKLEEDVADLKGNKPEGER